MRFLR
jgi:hypothetical protein